MSGPPAEQYSPDWQRAQGGVRLPGMRIKYIIPFPFDVGQDIRSAQVPSDLLGDGTHVECVPVRNTATLVDCYYEDLIFEMYIVEAGLRAEEEGYDAVVMDTVSDSGLTALRSRLSIPVLGPGLVSYAVAIMLGRRFSIITMWEQWRHLYIKNLDTYHLWGPLCLGARAAGIRPDMEELLSGKEETVFPRLTEEARLAITEDGADVILLGSTTMHQAAEYMARHLEAPVINPGPVAIKMAETMVRLGLSHSKVAFPSPAVIQDEKFFSLVSAPKPE